MLKLLRYFLFPVAIIYSSAVWVRNWLYDIKILKSASFNFPIICVGNIAVGGTGKTPMVEYLIRLLQNNFKTGTVSRGYKRKTKGYALANAATTALEIGDEPMQFHNKFPEVAVAVGEERLVAIPQLLHDRPQTEVIILDDAFQHRQVNAGLNIVLTACNEMYTRDKILPLGNLRDVKSGMKRAQIIVVTKCKAGLTVQEKERVIKEIDPLPHQTVYFTKTAYSKTYHLFNKMGSSITSHTHILVVCGIANPKPLVNFIAANVHHHQVMSFPDHHIFNSDDLASIKAAFEKIEHADKVILTTEKDGVRLMKFEEQLKDFPVFVLPVEHEFLFDEAGHFERQVTNFVKSFSRV